MEVDEGFSIGFIIWKIAQLILLLGVIYLVYWWFKSKTKKKR